VKGCGISSAEKVGSPTLGKCEKLPCFVVFFAPFSRLRFCQKSICQKTCQNLVGQFGSQLYDSLSNTVESHRQLRPVSRHATAPAAEAGDGLTRAEAVEAILRCQPAGDRPLRAARFAFRHSHGGIELGSGPSSAIEVIAVGRWFFGRSQELLPKETRTRGGP
jgi:hypothetical protein